MAERGNFRAVWFGLGVQCNRIGRKGVEFRCATCPVAFSLSAFITSHHTQQRQAPSSWLIRRFDSAWLLLSAAVWGKIFMLPAPQCSHQPPASQPPGQQQSSLGKYPSLDFQLLGGLKRVNTYSWLGGRAAVVGWRETSP